MPYIHSVSKAFPAHYHSQDEITEMVLKHYQGRVQNLERVRSFFKSVKVKGRHLAIPLEDYFKITTSFEKKNQAFIKVSLEILEVALKELLTSSGLKPSDISLLASTTVTGVAVPSLEARLMNKFEFKRDTKRLPLFGLGCLAGVAGIARVSEYLRAYPQEAAIFMSSELCTLTTQLDDLSVANFISTGLFGDGAAMVLMVGDEHPLAKKSNLEIISSQSDFFPNSENMMGWDIVDSGFKIVLNSGVPQIVEKNIPGAFDHFLQKNKIKKTEIGFYVSHPGGPKVLEAMENALNLKNGELELSWKSLESIGNLSSASVLMILEDTIKQNQMKGYGVMLAMGPAFCSEMVLLKYHKP